MLNSYDTFNVQLQPKTLQQYRKPPIKKPTTMPTPTLLPIIAIFILLPLYGHGQNSGSKAPSCISPDTAALTLHFEQGQCHWEAQRTDSTDIHFQAALNVLDIYLDQATQSSDTVCWSQAWNTVFDFTSRLQEKSHLQYALKAIKNSVRYFERMPVSEPLALAYQEAGKIYGRFRFNEQALEYSFKALEVREAIGFSIDISEVYNTIAVTYSAMGDQGSARVYVEKALQEYIKWEGPESKRVLNAMNNIGYLYQKEGDTLQAGKYYSAALELSLKISGSKSSATANVLNNMASLLFDQQRHAEAIPLLKKGAKISEEELGVLHPFTCTYYLELGRNYTQLGQYDLAEPYLTKARNGRLFSLGLQHFMTGFAYLGLAEYYAAKGELPLALKYIDTTYQAILFDPDDKLSLADVSYFPLLIQALETEVRLLSEQELSQDMLQHSCKPCGTLAASIEYLHRNTYNAKASRAMRLKLKPTLNICVNTTASLYRQTGDLDAYNIALSISEWNKSVNLFSELKDLSQKEVYRVPDSLRVLEWKIKRQLNMLDREIQASTDPQIKAGLLDQQYAQQEALRSLKATYASQFAKYYEDRFQLGRDMAVERFQKLLFIREQSSQTILEYYIGDSSIFIFLIRKDEVDLISIPLTSDIDKVIANMQDGIYAYFLSARGQSSKPDIETLTRQYIHSAHVLYNQLIRPIEDRITEEPLIIPDEKLQFIPFGLLLSEAPKNIKNFVSYPYWIKDKKIGYAFSLRVLETQMLRANGPLSPKSMLAVAPSVPLSNLPYSKYSTSDGLTSESSFLLDNEEEAYAIASLWKGDVITGKEATKEAFCSLMPSYKLLHIATHGQSDTLWGEKSYLTFTASPKSKTNRLYVEDLLALRMNTEMVVLSACETANGQFLKGEGIISITRAFTHAGTKSAVTSIWPMENQLTSRLMLNFHKELKQGVNKSEALRNAKLNYLAETPGFQSHPFFWGGIIAIGDMSPID